LCYSKSEDIVVEIIFPESLRASIFSSGHWKKCKVLRDISDYRNIDLFLYGDEIALFVDALRFIHPFLEEYTRKELVRMIRQLDRRDIHLIKLIAWDLSEKESVMV